MNVANLLRQTVTVTTIVASGTTDDMGDPGVEADEETTDFAGYLWQTQSDEDTANTDVQTETFDLVLHKSAAGLVDASSRATVDGITYEVIGTPWQAVNARTTQIEYVKMKVRRTR